MSKSSNVPRQAIAVMTIAGALATVAPASAQSTNPAPPGQETAPAPANVPKSGVVEPPDVDPKMARPVPNVDPAIDKPPAGVARPGAPTPPKTPPDVQPR